MKILFKDYLNGWWMTGFVSKDNSWFFGFSRVATQLEQNQIRTIMDAFDITDSRIIRKRGLWYSCKKDS